MSSLGLHHGSVNAGNPIQLPLVPRNGADGVNTMICIRRIFFPANGNQPTFSVPVPPQQLGQIASFPISYPTTAADRGRHVFQVFEWDKRNKVYSHADFNFYPCTYVVV